MMKSLIVLGLWAASMATALPSDCTACTSDSPSPLCQPACHEPPRESCDFYTTCAEAALHCGPDGYPIKYGDKNCNKFKDNLAKFTPQGQTWIWDTMSCLQHALVGPLGACGATCDSVTSLAFDSHPRCYVDSGVCDLPLEDLVETVLTINTDLFVGPALKQILSTATGCLEHYLQEIKDKIEELKQKMADDKAHAPKYLSEIGLLKVAQKELE